MAETQYGIPFIVANFTEISARSLKRIRFEKGRDDDFNERWLQRLVIRYPNVLPIEQIEPALTPSRRQSRLRCKPRPMRCSLCCQ
jgi:hypothetical protein